MKILLFEAENSKAKEKTLNGTGDNFKNYPQLPSNNLPIYLTGILLPLTESVGFLAR
jgi:hypothetical protein